MLANSMRTSSVKSPRRLVLALLLYVVADFTGPTTPGVFGQNPPLLIDPVAQATTASPARTAPEPLWASADDNEDALMSLYVLTRVPLAPETRWVALTRDDSAFVAPAPPRDSTPTPP